MEYFERIKVRDILYKNVTKAEYENVIVLGWVRTKRVSKNIAFLEINDGSSLKNLQVVILKPEKFPLDDINTGASLKITGYLEESQGNEQSIEMKAEEIIVVGDAPTDYILQKKRHSFEFLREIAHLRARTNTFGVVNRFRSIMANAIHEYFQNKKFNYIGQVIFDFGLLFFGMDVMGQGMKPLRSPRYLLI